VDDGAIIERVAGQMRDLPEDSWPRWVTAVELVRRAKQSVGLPAAGLEEYDPRTAEYLFVPADPLAHLRSFRITPVDGKEQEAWRRKTQERVLFRSESFAEGLPIVVWDDFGIGYVHLGVEVEGRKIPFIQLEEIFRNVPFVITLMPREWVVWFMTHLEKSGLDPALTEFLKRVLPVDDEVPGTPLVESDHLRWLMGLQDRIRRATVRVQGTDPQGEVAIAGTGTLVKLKGAIYVLTASHVVGPARGGLQVFTSEGLTLPAEVTWQDPASDLALLGPFTGKVGEAEVFPVAQTKGSETTLVLKVGHVGEPVTSELRPFPHFMWGMAETRGGDVVLYHPKAPGTSGGALVDLRTGELFGVISWGGSRDTHGPSVLRRRLEARLSAGMEEGIRLETAETLRGMDDADAKELLAQVEAAGAAGVVLLPRALVESARPERLEINVYGHDSVEYDALMALGVSIVDTPYYTLSDALETARNQLQRGSEDPKAVNAIDAKYESVLAQMLPPEYPLTLLIQPDSWQPNALRQKALTALITQAALHPQDRRLRNLIVRITSDSARAVTLQGTEYVAVLISA